MAIAVNATRLIAASNFNIGGFGQVAFTNAPAAGSAVIVSLATPTSTDVVQTVTDTKGNVYTRAATIQQGSALRVYIYICGSQKGLTTSDFMQVSGVTGTLLALAADEVTGLGSVTLPDKSATGTAGTSSATYATSATATTAIANELIWEAIATPQYNVTQTITPSDGATVQGSKVTTTNAALHTAYRIVSATGTYSAAGAFNTNNASLYTAAIATFPEPDATNNARRAASAVFVNVAATGPNRAASFVGVEVAGVITPPAGGTIKRRPLPIIA